MKKLRKLGAAVVLTFVLGLPAFAGEVLTPPCASPDPGETQTPPCAAAPGDMGTPGLTSSAPGDMGPMANAETAFTRIAADVLLDFLPFF